MRKSRLFGYACSWSTWQILRNVCVATSKAFVTGKRLRPKTEWDYAASNHELPDPERCLVQTIQSLSSTHFRVHNLGYSAGPQYIPKDAGSSVPRPRDYLRTQRVPYTFVSTLCQWPLPWGFRSRHLAPADIPWFQFQWVQYTERKL